MHCSNISLALLLMLNWPHNTHLFAGYQDTKCRLRQSNIFYDVSFLLWTTQARSVSECAARCIQQERCVSFLFWMAGSGKWKSCFGFGVESALLKSDFARKEPGSRLYDLEGRKAIYCGEVPVVPNAETSRSDGIYGDTISYECAVGYSQANGTNGQRICNATGQWIALPGMTDPICKVTLCGMPPTISNAKPFKSKPPYEFGEEVYYGCKKGTHNIAGTNATGRRACSQSGTWVQLTSDPECV